MLLRIARLPLISTIARMEWFRHLFYQLMLRIQKRRVMTFTQFLRVPTQLTALTGPVLDALMSGRTEEHIDIAAWGCSNGAEPYAIASMLLASRPGSSFTVHAYDIDPDLIERARSGVYTTEEVFGNKQVTADFVSSTFVELDGRYLVRAEIRDHVLFVAADALDERTVGLTPAADVIFAQNFLFHLRPRDAERAFVNITSRLTPRSILFIDGMDLDLRSRLTTRRGLEPLDFQIREIHDEARQVRTNWPICYWGLEPLSTRRPGWKRRYATIFVQMAPGHELERASSGDQEATRANADSGVNRVGCLAAQSRS